MVNLVYLYFALLIPNMMRFLTYFTVWKKTGKQSFIASYETKKMFGTKKQWMMPIQETILGVIFILAWNFNITFLAFGWLYDAIQDVFFTYFWTIKKKTPLQYKLKSLKARFITREVFLPYVVVGPLLALLGLNIYWFAGSTMALSIIFYLLAYNNT